MVVQRGPLIVVDIEGAEKALLDGASGILANDPKPIWLMEITTTEHQPQATAVNPHLLETFKCMSDAGYQAYAVGKELTPVSMAQVEAAQKGDVSALSSYNFLFRDA